MEKRKERNHAFQSLIKLLRWARRYWLSYLLLGCIVIVSSLIPTGTADATRRLMNAVFNKSISDLFVSISFFVVIFAVGIVMEIVRSWFMQRTLNRTTLDLQRAVLERMFLLNLKQLSRWHTGEQIQRLNGSAVSAQEGMNEKIPQVIEQALSILFLFTYLSILSWPLTIGVIVIAIIIPLIGLVTAKPIHNWQQNANQSKADQDAKLQDQMQGADNVRMYNLRPQFNRRWGKIVQTTLRGNIRVHMWSAFSSMLTFFGYWLGQIYIFGLGAWLVFQGQLEVGVIAAFYVSYEQLIYPVMRLLNIWPTIQNTLAHFGRVCEMADPTEHKPLTPGRETLPSKGDIVMDQVSFSYIPNKPILHDCSLTIKQGSTTALVGTSGGGKSTILKLLLGLYTPDGGQIRIGDTVLTQSNLGTWQAQIGYVPQNTHLFAGTVMDNIRIGKLNATSEEVVEAAKFAQADEFIQALPEKYQTYLGELGQRLSGGQRQRIAIARAYLRNPNLLLLDEPTSALDGHNEQLIKESVEKLMNQRTVVVVAHRLSTIRNADYIAVIESGHVVEFGSHDELMEKNGRYAAFIRAENWADRTEEVQVS
ncbi:ABC transporter ATP-binding protein [Bacillus niameyensis]|uniref:ABC transporter ATP-binding protein n=1 Tax=Bacillus niameyensis TaxID=1522308 RepID=UPI0007823608|nr:ABC transporter ATP-binding protein [Bacillus niameyensis]